MPAISVLIPVFNAESTLAACLASLRRQSWNDFECLVLNDGSTDSSLSIARGVASKDERFRVVDMPHRGIVPTLNEGLQLCRGHLIARMDADDLMLKDRLRLQHAKMQGDASLAGVGCHVRLFPRKQMTGGRSDYERWLNRMVSPDDIAANLYVECPLAHPTWLIKKEVYLREPYREHDWPEDYELLCRWSQAGYRFGVVPKRLLLWREGPSRLSRCDPRYGLDRFTSLRAHFLARGPLRDSDNYVLWGYGDTGKALRKALALLGRHPRKIIELHPGRIGQQIHGARVVHPDAIDARRDRPLLVSVAGAVAREQIRGALFTLGMQESVDFFCCA